MTTRSDAPAFASVRSPLIRPSLHRVNGRSSAPLFASVGASLPNQMFDAVERFVKARVAEAGASTRRRAMRFPLFAHVGSSTRSASTGFTVSRVADLSLATPASFTVKKSGSLKPASDAEIDAAFKRVDKNNSGDIDRAELQAACAALGE